MAEVMPPLFVQFEKIENFVCKSANHSSTDFPSVAVRSSIRMDYLASSFSISQHSQGLAKTDCSVTQQL